MNKGRSRENNISRLKEHIDYEELNKETSERLMEIERLKVLGEKFLSEKAKIEEEIEKVQMSIISDKDKEKIIEELDYAIDCLQKQYEQNVSVEEIKVQGEINANFEKMDEAVEELEHQADSIRDVTLEAAIVDMREPADKAEEKKQDFIKMRNDYKEKLALQMEQAEMIQRQIRVRRLSDRK